MNELFMLYPFHKELVFGNYYYYYIYFLFFFIFLILFLFHFIIIIIIIIIAKFLHRVQRQKNRQFSKKLIERRYVVG